ncbi:MAG TPA: 16S rRNA (cytosine(1402)-N(4))-methyltransferase [Solirubrobacteraceae bacterium]|nr:16S rRNA (cytosine(1402)-N(4))-methyltransferase [Solirubrobacteraceae bacterium]
MPTVHIPVLAGELVDVLDPRPGQVAIDCTFGGGGHAELVAQRLGAAGTLIAIDRDPEAQARFAELAREAPCAVRFIHAGFAEALTVLGEEGLRADLAYFDLGMSSMQVDTRERGFSYSYDAPLDMRMDPAQSLDARTLLASAPERQLAGLLREYGEERHAGAIARAIVRRPDLLVADEPTGNIDDDIAMLLVRVFERINRLGTTVLIATHDISFARQFSHRRFHLDRGVLTAANDGAPA